MAISNSLFVGKARKSAGNVTARNVRGRVILSEKIQSNTSKSFAQVRQRMAFKWAAVMGKLMKPIVDHSFVVRGQYQSSYNAFTSNAIGGARVIGGNVASMNDYPFAPSPVIISRGNVPQYGADVAITGTGTTSQNVTTAFANGSAFDGMTLTGLDDRGFDDKYVLNARGLRPGQMISFVVVVYRAGVGTLMEWKRILYTTSNDTIVSTSPLYDNVIDSSNEGQNNPATIKAPYQLVGAAVIVSEVDGSGNVFDVSTSRLVTAPEAQLKLIYGGESLPTLALASVYAADDASLRYEMPEMGWQVDEALLLNPVELESGSGDDMGGGYIPTIAGGDFVIR